MPIPAEAIQAALSAAIPTLAALLNDPRPNRWWLRVLIVVALTCGAAALQLYYAKTPITWESWSHEALILAVGSQGVHRLLKVAFGRIEEASGNGVGTAIDALLRGGKSATPISGLEEDLGRIERMLNAGLLKPEEYQQMRAAAILAATKKEGTI
jgi:hypothetical protein